MKAMQAMSQSRDNAMARRFGVTRADLKVHE